MLGLESAFSVLYSTMVTSGLLSWDDLSRVMSHTPARIGGLETQGRSIEVGSPAELTLVDPSVSKVFANTDLASKSSNSPYLGLELQGEVISTIHHGYLTLENSTLLDPSDVATAARKHSYE
jgi:dihydroorotase